MEGMEGHGGSELGAQLCWAARSEGSHKRISLMNPTGSFVCDFPPIVPAAEGGAQL
jgi:hypothetical protein